MRERVLKVLIENTSNDGKKEKKMIILKFKQKISSFMSRMKLKALLDFFGKFILDGVEYLCFYLLTFK